MSQQDPYVIPHDKDDKDATDPLFDPDATDKVQQKRLATRPWLNDPELPIKSKTRWENFEIKYMLENVDQYLGMYDRFSVFRQQDSKILYDQFIKDRPNWIRSYVAMYSKMRSIAEEYHKGTLRENIRRMVDGMDNSEVFLSAFVPYVYVTDRSHKRSRSEVMSDDSDDQEPHNKHRAELRPRTTSSKQDIEVEEAPYKMQSMEELASNAGLLRPLAVPPIIKPIPLDLIPTTKPEQTQVFVDVETSMLLFSVKSTMLGALLAVYQCKGKFAHNSEERISLENTALALLTQISNIDHAMHRLS